MQTMNKGAIFSLFYLPPIQFFARFRQQQENILIESAEHFPKQSYRNRAEIQSPNGRLNLIIPVVKGSKVHTPVKDVKISYDFDWQRLHRLSLETCYRSSAFFEYYEDELAPFYQKKWSYLFDYNQELLSLLLKFLKLDIAYRFTDVYEKEYSEEYRDFRYTIHPKKTSDVISIPYYQVFEDRNGFMQNLSIVDLLFNQGPQSKSFF